MFLSLFNKIVFVLTNDTCSRGFLVVFLIRFRNTYMFEDIYI